MLLYFGAKSLNSQILYFRSPSPMKIMGGIDEISKSVLKQHRFFIASEVFTLL